MASHNRSDIDEAYAEDTFYPTSLKKLFQDGQFSDCTIKCKEREWELHCNILAARSGFFATAFDGPFMESQAKIFVLVDDDPSAIHILLQHLYYLFTSEKELSVAEQATDPGFSGYLWTFIHLIIGADKYRVHALKTLRLKALPTELGFGVEMLLDVELFGMPLAKYSGRTVWILDCIFGSDACNALNEAKIPAAEFIADVYTNLKSFREDPNGYLAQSPELNALVLGYISDKIYARDH